MSRAYKHEMLLIGLSDERGVTRYAAIVVCHSSLTTRVCSYRLRLWRPLIPIFGPKSASFVGQSQFEIFQFPYLHPEVDQRLVCH